MTPALPKPPAPFSSIAIPTSPAGEQATGPAKVPGKKKVTPVMLPSKLKGTTSSQNSVAGRWGEVPPANLEGKLLGEAVADPNNPVKQLSLGEYYLKRQAYGEAVQVFQALGKRFPELPHSNVYLGEAYFGLGDFAKAAESYGQYLAKEPRDLFVLKLRVEANQKLLVQGKADGSLDAASVAKLQKSILRDQAMEFAAGADDEAKRIDALEKDLKEFMNGSPEAAKGALEALHEVAESFLFFADQASGEPGQEFVREKLNGLAAHTLEMMAKIADGSVHEEIRKRAPLYDAQRLLAQGDLEAAKSAFEKVQGEFPEAKAIVAQMEKAELRGKNLAILSAWDSYIEEGESTQLDQAKGLLGKGVGFLIDSFRSDQGSFLADIHSRWNIDRELLGYVRGRLENGESDTVHAALEQAAEQGPEKFRARAKVLLADGKARDNAGSYVLANLIEYGSQLKPDPEMAKQLLFDADQLEARYSAVKTPFAIYSIVQATATEEGDRDAAGGALTAMEKGKQLPDIVWDMIRTTGTDDLAQLATMAAASKVGGLAKLATLNRLQKAGITGYKAMVLAWGASTMAEGTALWAMNTAKEGIFHDTSKVFSPEHLAKSYGANLIMIGGLKAMGSVGQKFSPQVARALGLVAQEGKLSTAGSALQWGLNHSAGLSGMIATSQLNQLLGLTGAPKGGLRESLVRDFFGYVKYGVAQKGFDHSLGEGFAKATEKLHGDTLVREAEVQVEAQMKKLGHSAKQRTKDGSPIFQSPEAQGLYRQLVQETLTKPGFDAAKAVAFLRRKDLGGLNGYLRGFGLKAHVEGKGVAGFEARSPHEEAGISVRPKPASPPVNPLAWLSNPLMQPLFWFLGAGGIGGGMPAGKLPAPARPASIQPLAVKGSPFIYRSQGQTGIEFEFMVSFAGFREGKPLWLMNLGTVPNTPFVRAVEIDGRRAEGATVALTPGQRLRAADGKEFVFNPPPVEVPAEPASPWARKQVAGALPEHPAPQSPVPSRDFTPTKSGERFGVDPQSHAQCTFVQGQDGTWWLFDGWQEPSSRPPIVNGKPMNEPTPVRDGDRIDLGNTVLVFREPGKQKEAFNGEDTVSSVRLTPDRKLTAMLLPGLATFFAADPAQASDGVSGMGSTETVMVLGILALVGGGTLARRWIAKAMAARRGETEKKEQHEQKEEPAKGSQTWDPRVEAAAQRFSSADYQERRAAVDELVKLIPDLPESQRLEAALLVEGRLGDPDSNVILRATHRLGEAAKSLSEADRTKLAGKVAKRFADPNHEKRSDALYAYAGVLHSAADPLILTGADLFQGMLKDPDSRIRSSASNLLGSIIRKLPASQRLARTLAILEGFGQATQAEHERLGNVFIDVLPSLQQNELLQVALKIEGHLTDVDSNAAMNAIWTLKPVFYRLSMGQQKQVLDKIESRKSRPENKEHPDLEAQYADLALGELQELLPPGGAVPGYRLDAFEPLSAYLARHNADIFDRWAEAVAKAADQAVRDRLAYRAQHGGAKKSIVRDPNEPNPTKLVFEATEGTEVRLDKPISVEEQAGIRQRLDDVHARYGDGDDGQLHFGGNVPDCPVKRKIYANPDFRHLPAFLEAFYRIAREENLPIIQSKVNFDALAQEDGRVVGQSHNTFCLYTPEDGKVDKIADAIERAAKESGAKLLAQKPESYPKGVHALGGKLILGIDLAGRASFDNWTGSLVGVAIKTAEKSLENNGQAPSAEVMARIKAAMKAELQKTRGMGPDQFLSFP